MRKWNSTRLVTRLQLFHMEHSGIPTIQHSAAQTLRFRATPTMLRSG